MKTCIIAFIGVIVSVLSVSANAQEYSWSSGSIDGSRTGCSHSKQDDASKSIGVMHRGNYISPNGNHFDSSSTTAKVASLVLDAHPKIAYVKEIIAFAPEAMKLSYPESTLSNWYVDLVMDKVAALSGKKIDFGLCNVGGIRAEIPKGDVILDDILSMFPFDNTLYYLEMYGKDIRTLFDEMAERQLIEAVGGVKVLVDGTTISSIEIGGQPLDDDKLYSVASISYLYGGGDNIKLESYAVNPQEFNVLIKDAVLERVKQITAEGKKLKYKTDGRVIINPAK